MRDPLDREGVSVSSRSRVTLAFLSLVLGALLLATPAAADSDAPTVIIETPSQGGGFYQGQRVQAAYDCLPGELGWPVVVCEGDAPVGEWLDTSSVGEPCTRSARRSPWTRPT